VVWQGELTTVSAKRIVTHPKEPWSLHGIQNFIGRRRHQIIRHHRFKLYFRIQVDGVRISAVGLNVRVEGILGYRS
jgi:hypothetical protein